jgi:hypothetical protein
MDCLVDSAPSVNTSDAKDSFIKALCQFQSHYNSENVFWTSVSVDNDVFVQLWD